MVTALAYPVLVLRGRRGGPEGELEARRRWHRLLTMETAFFVALLLSGFLAMRLHGWRLGYPRWLSLKLGLVAFLLVPLETIYAYAARGFLTRGLRKTKAPPFTREMERGVSMQEMVWALAIPLVGLALPLLVWLSLARPF